jgi:hypothetical protein
MNSRSAPAERRCFSRAAAHARGASGSPHAHIEAMPHASALEKIVQRGELLRTEPRPKNGLESAPLDSFA